MPTLSSNRTGVPVGFCGDGYRIIVRSIVSPAASLGITRQVTVFVAGGFPRRPARPHAVPAKHHAGVDNLPLRDLDRPPVNPMRHGRGCRDPGHAWAARSGRFTCPGLRFRLWVAVFSLSPATWTVLRATPNSRAISLIPLILLPCTKRARLIRATVSTTSISPTIHMLGWRDRTRQRGSALDADHPSQGVKIPRRSTAGLRFRLSGGSAAQHPRP